MAEDRPLGLGKDHKELKEKKKRKNKQNSYLLNQYLYQDARGLSMENQDLEGQHPF